MNSLSWFIYLVQFVDALTTVFIWGAVVTLVVYAARWAHAGIAADNAKYAARWDQNKSSAEAGKIFSEVLAAKRPPLALHMIAFLACIAVAAVIPSRQTMILIAGSEAGERALQSDAVSDGMKLVKLWIKTETDKLTKEAAK